ncbi:hypothetical protein J4481_02465 [Candidatus Pacearchaeota archaeon]|nr:hypothetical protein [Candidatus Pacearchaeota archaeon]
MKRITEYVLSQEEWVSLLPSVKEEGYQVHGYNGYEELTIDDGSRTSLDENRRMFSVCIPLKDGMKLRVKDSKLVQVIDSILDN